MKLVSENHVLNTCTYGTNVLKCLGIYEGVEMEIWQYAVIGIVGLVVLIIVGSSWRHLKWRHGLLLSAIVLLAALWGVQWSGVADLDVENLSVVALVIVTFVYAVSTDRIADETSKQSENSERQIQVLKDQQHNAVAPVVDLQSASGANDIEVHLVNVGMGPALNLRCWIEDEHYPELKTRGFTMTALGVRIRVDPGPPKTIPTGIRGYHLERNLCSLCVQYEDIFGQKYESIFDYTPEDTKPAMRYRRVSDATSAIDETSKGDGTR